MPERGLLEELTRRQQQMPRNVLDLLAPNLTSMVLREQAPPLENVHDLPGKVPGTGDPRDVAALNEAAHVLALLAPLGVTTAPFRRVAAPFFRRAGRISVPERKGGNVIRDKDDD